MKRVLILILLGKLILSTALAQFDASNPQTYILAGLEVVGAQFSDESEIKAVSGLAVGQTYQIPGADISDAIRRLWDENVFSDIRIEVTEASETAVMLEINVTERPRISKFDFEGISKSQADDLREKINFIRGTILTDSKRQSAKRIIRNFYVEKGFFNTEVTITSELDKILKNGVLVTISVDKGKKIKIDDIVVSGNESTPEKKLLRKMKKVNEKRWWRFWARSKYVPKTYREAKAMVIEYYNDLGYRDALIERDTVYRVDDKHVRVEMDIYEGIKYYHRNINWAGNVKYNSEFLEQKLGIDKGDIYSMKKLNQRLSGDPQSGDVSSLYLDDGYLFLDISPVEVLVEGDSIDLEIRVREGPQATIRKVIVEGNTKTSDDVIIRELRTTPGQKFSRDLIIRSQRELLALNYFNQENLGIVPMPDQKTGTVDLKYTVEERPADQLQLQGGWGGRVRDPLTGEVIAGGFVGTVQLAFNNFSTRRFFDPKAWRPVPSGDGQRLSLSFQMNGVGYRNFTVSFQEPWFGGKKANLFGVSASYLVFQNRTGGILGVGGNSSLFRNTIFSGSVDFGTRLKFPDDYFRSQTSFGYKYYDIQNPANFFPGFTGEDQAFINIITLRQSFDRTSVDAPIYPRSGSIISLSVEATPPYSLFDGTSDYSDQSPSQKFRFLEYHKWEFNSSWFWNIVGNMVLNAKVEAGYLGAYNSNLGIPPFERYTLGGAGLLQNGFAGLIGLDVIALRGYDNQVLNNNNEYFPIYNRMLLELRYPITLNQSAPVWVLAFAEGGNGYRRFREYNPFDIKRAVGAGIRVMLPMVGLLGLDWAYGFDRVRDTDLDVSGAQFHFIIGQQF